MNLSTYYKIKEKFEHEISIVPGGEAGTVYTPKRIQFEMVHMMLMTDLENNRPSFIKIFEPLWSEFLEQGNVKTILLHKQTSSNYQSDFKTLLDYFLDKSIIDFASGTGMLLLSYLEWVLFLCYREDRLSDFRNYVITRVTAIDVNSEALKAFEMIMKTLFEALGIFEPISLDLRCLNTLTSKIEGPYDFVISNPPYIGEKGHTHLFDKVKETTMGKSFYEGKMDYFYFFIYKAYEAVSPRGTACFLTTNYFYTADGAKKLRQFLNNHFYIHILKDYENEALFDGRNLHSTAYTLNKTPKDMVKLLHREDVTIPKNQLFSEKGHIQMITSSLTYDIINKINQLKIGDLDDFYDVKQGIVSGADRFFVYKEDQIQNLDPNLRPLIKPFYKNSQIRHYTVDYNPRFYILYVDNQSLINMNSNSIDLLKKLLEPHKDLLMKRREVQNGVREWYQLTWPRTVDLFETEKIVVPQRSKKNAFAYVKAPYYASADVYYIKPKDKPPLHLDELTLVLNSKLYYFWLYNQGKRKGDLLELYASPLKSLPILNISSEDIDLIKSNGSSLFKSNGSEGFKDQEIESILMIDRVLYKILNLSLEEIKYIEEFKNENYS